VAVTKLLRFGYVCCSVVISMAASPVHAGVLPEERSDVMYHAYDGGGTKVDGPMVLVRKSFADKVSVYGSYYVDNISGASIDVMTTASPYKDQRTERSVGVDYLRQNSMISASLINSEENDYLSDTFNLNLSHEMFGSMTTVTVGYSQGQDTVKRVDTDFQENIDRYQYRLGLSQILTRTLLANLSFEAMAEEGYLNNPYRAARYSGTLVRERYPRTRQSQAVSLRLAKGLSADDGTLHSSVHIGARYFTDTWEITANDLEIGYQRRFSPLWLGEFRYRNYRQTAASFYSDNFTTEMAYMARDKELSTFNSHTLGVKFTRTLWERRDSMSKSSLSVAYDRIRYNYDNFTDVRNGQLYTFDANAVQLFWSLWY
jgi:hypothetical protein